MSVTEAPTSTFSKNAFYKGLDAVIDEHGLESPFLSQLDRNFRAWLDDVNTTDPFVFPKAESSPASADHIRAFVGFIERNFVSFNQIPEREWGGEKHSTHLVALKFQTKMPGIFISLPVDPGRNIELSKH